MGVVFLTTEDDDDDSNGVEMPHHPDLRYL